MLFDLTTTLLSPTHTHTHKCAALLGCYEGRYEARIHTTQNTAHTALSRL